VSANKKINNEGVVNHGWTDSVQQKFTK
jgi:hypothetical protein